MQTQNNTRNKTNTRVDYTSLTYRGRQYVSLDAMIPVVASDYAKRDFTTATLLAQSLGVDVTREELAELLIDIKASMIRSAIAEKTKNSNLFKAA